MTKTAANIQAAHRFIKRNGLRGVQSVVLQAQDGRYASMVSILGKNAGRSTILHLGYGKTAAIAQRFASSNAIAFASI